jgi:hypothetical protein
MSRGSSRRCDNPGFGPRIRTLRVRSTLILHWAVPWKTEMEIPNTALAWHLKSMGTRRRKLPQEAR